MNRFLKKGVLLHSFSDQSGCVFLVSHSGETSSVLMSESEIVTILSDESIIDEENEQSIAIKSLIQKKIFIPLSNKNNNVE
jgi:hypothetical protein